MRGTILNLLVTLPIASVFLWRTEAPPTAFIAAYFAVLIGLAASAFVYLRIGSAQDRWLTLFDDSASGPPPRS